MYTCCEIRAAFTSPELTEHERRMIETLMVRPGAGARELAAAMDYKDFGGWNLQFGTMCRKRFPDTAVDEDKPVEAWSRAIIDFDRTAEGWTWRLRPEALHAFQSLRIAPMTVPA